MSAIGSSFSRLQSFTEPSMAHEARLSSDGSRSIVDRGWKTMAEALHLWPRKTFFSVQLGMSHNLQIPLLKISSELFLGTFKLSAI